MARIDKFYIINADNNQAVIDLNNKDEIFIEDLPKNWKIAAQATGSQSIKFTLNNVVTSVNNPPLIHPSGNLSKNDYVLYARSFELPNLQGVVSSEKRVSFTLKNKVAPIVQHLFIRDINQNKDILELLNNQIVDLSKLPNEWNIRAEIANAKSAKLSLDGKSNLESNEPYCIFGDNVALKLNEGQHDFTAVGFTNEDFTNPGAIKSIVFNVVKSSTPQPPLPINIPIFGICTGTKDDFNKLVTAFKDVGVKSIRVWLDISWNKTPTFDHLKKFKDAGFSICACLHTSEVPTYNQAKAFFTNAVKAGKDILDFWEIINEPNLTKYWSGTLQQYVDNVLKPAYEVLHLAGEKVAGAAISEDINDLKDLIKCGYLNYCDYASFHPYKNTPKDHIDVVKAAKALVGSKPLLLTEWNMHAKWGGLSYEEWADSLDFVYQSIKNYISGAWYYRSIVSGEFAGKAAILKADLTPNQLFYDGVKKIKKD